ncbi:hypothetical protein DW685_02305 [Lachnospiraceae bacterium AM25-40]|nr:hypothetical protein DW685_02305 [Lachnospiraceae bacterium AM25-40]
MIPLSSNEVVSKAFAFNKKGGTADIDKIIRPLQSETGSRGRSFFILLDIESYETNSFPAKRKRGE